MITGCLGRASPEIRGTKVDSRCSRFEEISCVKWGWPCLSKTRDAVVRRERGLEGIGTVQRENSGLRKQQP